MNKKKHGNRNGHEIINSQIYSRDVPVTKIDELTAFDEIDTVKIIIETPKGSRNKYKYNLESGLFEVGFALQAGLTFPFDFGFIPSTKAEDGDPLDAIVLMDEPAFPGCMIKATIIGVLEAKQADKETKNKLIRNDRLLGVHAASVDFGQFKTWQDLPTTILEEIELFFIFYNKCRKKKFEPLGWKNQKIAYKLIEKSLSKKEGK